MSTLLKELHNLIPSYSNLFHWSDENSQATNLCFEDPVNVDIAPFYFSEFYHRRETEVCYTFPELLRRYRGVITLQHFVKNDLKEFYKHDYYNLIFRPISNHHCLYATLHENDRPVGLLALGRAQCDLEFTPQEHERLERISPYITHGLTTADGLQTGWIDGDEAGLIIMGKRGHLVHLSERGRKLLFMASYPKISPLTINFKHHDFATSARLIQLCANLRAVFEGNERALPPVWHHQNAWGRFCFRAYWLDKVNHSHSSAIGITVTHQIPLAVKLVRLQETLFTSQKQLELGLLLISGKSYFKIAKQLCQNEATIIAQSKRLYHTLRTRTREEFMTKLRSL